MTKDRLPVTQAIRVLKKSGTGYTLYPYRYEEKGGTGAAARELNVEEHQVIKTLVMENQRGEAEGFWSRDIILAAYSGVTGFDALQKQGRRHVFRQREGSIRDRSETDLSDRRHNSSRTTTSLCMW